MCGRMVLTRSAEEIVSEFELEEGETGFEWPPRYNVAPSQQIPIIRRVGRSPSQLAQARWGLIPTWAKDASIGHRLINARSETAAEKPSFRSAFRQRRCLVPADGFYEWKRDPSVAGRKGRPPSTPFYFRRPSGASLAIAGLWEAWTDSATGEFIESATLLTTEANGDVQAIHHRMPVLLEAPDWARWLDPAVGDRAILEPLLKPAALGTLESFAVARLVNNPRHDAPDCIDRVS